MLNNNNSTVRDFKLRSTEDGIHLEGSILWLDAHKTKELSFLSTPTVRKNFTGPQFIATEETIKILQINRKHPKALICQYNHPFALGKLKIELLPSGSCLGSASLHIEAPKKQILYAPTLQTQKINIVRKIQLREAETLILEAFHPTPAKALPSRKKEKERLLNQVEKELRQGKNPAILCNPIVTAQEITELLSSYQIPVLVHPYIHRVNRVYESFGCKLGTYYSRSDSPTPHVRIIPYPFKNLPAVLNDNKTPFFLIDEKIGENLDPFDYFESDSSNRFVLSPVCDVKDLKEVIQKVNPNEIYVFGPYANRYVQEMTSFTANVKVLNPNDQPSLF